jgi:chromosome segregation ATPase
MHPAGHVKYEYLASGLLYCEGCQVKMVVQTRFKQRGKVLKTPQGDYRCRRRSQGYPGPKCVCQIGAKKLDAQVWAKVWALFANPGEFERRIKEKIATLQTQEEDAKGTCEKLERQQEDLLLERQKVITQWRKGKMTDEDYDLQIASLTIEQEELERELNEKRLLVGNKAERLIEVARLYREKVVNGATGLNDEPKTPEEARLQFQIRRKFVERLVTRVEVMADKVVKVYTEINLAEATEETNPVQINQESTH